MEEILDKEIAQEALKIKGEARGISFKGEMDYILKEKGEQGLELLEQEIARMGVPIRHQDIKITQFYPIGYEIIIMLAIKKLFNLSDEQLRKMGEFESKLSLIVRVFMKHFFSIQSAAKEAPNVWRKNYTIGQLEVAEINEEKKYAVLRVRDFSMHPIICTILEGYFASIGKMIVNKKVACRELKCMHKGDPYHEFSLKW